MDPKASVLPTAPQRLTQSEADAMAYKDAVKMTSIEGQRCGVNGGQKYS